MKKEELIEKYGLEWYEQWNAYRNANNKARYKNDSEYRGSIKAQRNARYQNDSEYRESKKAYRRERYVKDGRIDLIENYELAVNDGIENWDIHHRLELHSDGSIRFTKKSLLKLDLYYNRPSAELIWLKHSEHIRMHAKAQGLN